MSRSDIIQLERSYGVGNNSRTYVGSSGEIGAGLLANDVLASFRMIGSAPSIQTVSDCFIEQLRLRVTTITAFATPISTARALKLCPLTAGPTGGASGFVVAKEAATSSLDPNVLVATTGPLVGGGAGNPFEIFSLAHVGTAGASIEYVFGPRVAKLQMPALSFLGIAVVSNFDAAGTIKIDVALDFIYEGSNWNR